MAKGAAELPAAVSGDMQKIQQLVELQGELVELARKNDQSQKHCDALWRDLERGTRRTRGGGGPVSAAVRLARLRGRLLAELRERITPLRNRLLKTES